MQHRLFEMCYINKFDLDHDLVFYALCIPTNTLLRPLLRMKFGESILWQFFSQFLLWFKPYCAAPALILFQLLHDVVYVIVTKKSAFLCVQLHSAACKEHFLSVKHGSERFLKMPHWHISWPNFKFSEKNIQDDLHLGKGGTCVRTL